MEEEDGNDAVEVRESRLAGDWSAGGQIAEEKESSLVCDGCLLSGVEQALI
jgi:hypothetical protein